MVHSKQAVDPGRITRQCPRKPSVPPSSKGIIVVGSRFPVKGSDLVKLHKMEFIYLRPSRLSSPEITASNCLKKSIGND